MARINAGANPDGAADQDVYLKALLSSGSVDHIEYGAYISKVIKRPLATGVGNHWWHTLKAADYTGHQLADPAGKYKKPTGW